MTPDTPGDRSSSRVSDAGVSTVPIDLAGVGQGRDGSALT